MKISVFGLGYVGCITAACLAKEGHEVVGVDVNSKKVDMINQGKSPVIEKDIESIIAETVNHRVRKSGSLKATMDETRAVVDTEITLICVGTPSNENGSLNLDYVRKCAADIGEGLNEKDDYHVIVVRSTVLPGTIEEMLIKEIEYTSGKRCGRDFGVVMNPEFLRESTSVFDFYNPPMTVIGEYDNQSGDLVEKMYHFLKAPVVRTNIKTAEMVKYVNNSFHALKVSFANEVGSLCKAIGIDSHKVMDIFCMDNKLNLSSYYLKPGFAFGGSCLPKDLRALNYKANRMDVSTPLLQAIMKSNKQHIENVVRRIVNTGKKKIGILGLSFKSGTDDLRESPVVILVETLIGKGYDIRIYDQNVSLAKLFGANKEYIEKGIPHISSLLLEKMEDVLHFSDLIVIGNKAEEFLPVMNGHAGDKIIFDLVRLTRRMDKVPKGYNGIGW